MKQKQASSPDKKRTSQISEQQENLIKQLKAMDELATALGERLKPVRCAACQPPSGGRITRDVVKATLSPHADFLRGASGLAESINVRMTNIMDEIAC